MFHSILSLLDPRLPRDGGFRPISPGRTLEESRVGPSVTKQEESDKMARVTARTTLRLSSSQKELVDELKQIVHIALLSKYLASEVRVRKTIQKTTRWNYPYYEATITVDISFEDKMQQTTLVRGF